MAFSLMATLGIGILASALSTLGLEILIGFILPLVAILVFIGGIIWRIITWARLPVPFSIATTGGQQKSLPWIKPAPIDSPNSCIGVAIRMALEVFAFRSLFRNTTAQTFTDDDGPRIVYWSSKWLWVFSLLFHYCFLVVFLRHFRFFLDPVPFFITWAEYLDGLMQIGAPRLFMSGVALLVAVLFLLFRRLRDPKLRYISLPADYFPLFLVIGIALSGIMMRYWFKTDIASVKVLIMGLVTFSPSFPPSVDGIFYAHIALVSALLIYFPFSKMMHGAGLLFSPTRNMPANTRQVRHINPWNPPKKHRSYAEYEDEFRDVMAEAGLPLEKEPEEAAR